MKKTLLFLFLAVLSFGPARAQCISTCSNYAVSPVSFSLFSNTGTTLNALFAPTADDGTVSVPIGFNFDFYCSTYANVIVCTNGFMQFDYGTPLGFGMPVYSHPPQNFPDAATPNGLVALQMNDFDLTTTGSISYTTVGNAPYRQFILTYDNVPIWYNPVTNLPPSSVYNTGQIVLYETSNIIEIHTGAVGQSPYLGTQGIENTTGTLGAAAPGRNLAAWTGSNSAYQFSPYTPGPPSTITGNSVVCQGETGSYQATFIIGAMSYSWSLPQGWSGNSSLSSIIASAGTTGNLSVTATYSCGTSLPAVFNVSVIPAPTVGIGQASPAIICSGKTITINPSGALTYTLNPGGLVGVPPFTDTPPITTVYSVSGTNSFGCVSFNTATTTVTVKETPSIAVNSGSVCLGQTFTITPTGAPNYSVTGSFFNVTPTLAAQYSYSVTGTGSTGCVSDPVVSLLTVFGLPTITATPSRSLICRKESSVLTATGAVSYVWGNQSVSPSITVSPNTGTVYVVTGTDVNGCKNTATVNLAVNPCTGVNEFSGNTRSVKLFPNPTSGAFEIRVSSFSDKAVMEIYNAIGQLLVTEKIQSETTEINLRAYNSGLYYVKVKDGDTEEMIKLVKQ